MADLIVELVDLPSAATAVALRMTNLGKKPFFLYRSLVDRSHLCAEVFQFDGHDEYRGPHVPSDVEEQVQIKPRRTAIFEFDLSRWYPVLPADARIRYDSLHPGPTDDTYHHVTSNWLSLGRSV